MRQRPWRPASLVLGLLGAAGCTEEVDSSSIRTSGMYADFEVLAEGDGRSELKLILRVGGDDSNTYIRLTGGDALLVKVDGDARAVRKHEGAGNRIWYESSVDSDAGGTTFTVALERGEDNTEAPESRVSLPPPFELEGLEDGDPVSRYDGVTLTWEPDEEGDFDTAWRLDGDCLFLESGTTEDGALTLTSRDFDLSGDDDARCDATLVVERIRKGTVDDAYGEGGRFHAIQRRALRFRSVP